jgi:hypothetical protein
VKVERSGRVSRSRSDRPQRCAVQPFGFEDFPRSIEDQAALEVADGLAPAGS